MAACHFVDGECVNASPKTVMGAEGKGLRSDPSSGGPGRSDQLHQYQMTGRGKKRGRSPRRGGDNTSEEGGPQFGEGDEDACMEAMEAAYHADLVNVLRHPEVHRALGLSGPPNRIEHSTLEERMQTMRLVPRV